VNRAVDSVERRSYTTPALLLRVVQMRVLRPEDLDLASDNADLLAANDLVVFFHGKGVIQVDVLRGASLADWRGSQVDWRTWTIPNEQLVLGTDYRVCKSESQTADLNIRPP
jgi:hypothetical protein